MKLLLASEFDDIFHKVKPIIKRASGNKVVFIPTISCGASEAASYYDQLAPFKSLGMECQILELAGKSKDDVQKTLKDAAIIYVGCGNTFFHLEHMQKCDFKSILLEKLKRDVLYIGSSAGAIIMAPDLTYIIPMDDPAAASANGTKALGLVDFSFLPHCDHPEMGDDAAQIIKNHKPNDPPLYAMNDDQAIYVENGVVRIL